MKDPRTVSGFTKNIVLPAGYLFFDKFDSDGNPIGERLLADTPGFTIAVTTENFKDYDDDGPVMELNMDIPTSIERSANAEVKDMAGENLSLFTIADLSTLTTIAGAVTAKPINGGNGVLQGHWYQLGEDATHPAGVRGIESVDIDVAGVPQTVDVDYELDAELGRVYIIPGGGIPDGTVITSDYNTTAVSWDQISTNSLGAAKGRLRYVAHNTAGANRDAFMPNVVMSPNGEITWKSRDEVQKMSFQIGIQKPADGTPALYINGRAA